jgi:hypothetical protein
VNPGFRGDTYYLLELRFEMVEMMKLKRMAWAGHITCTESYSDTLKSTDHLGDTTYEDVDLVHLAEERDSRKLVRTL